MTDLPKPSSLNPGLGFCFAPAAGRTQEGAEELAVPKGRAGAILNQLGIGVFLCSQR